MDDFLSGVGIALVTPFNEEKKIDFHSLGKLVEGLIKIKKIKYLVLFGSTAEVPNLEEEEKNKIIDFVFELTKDKIPLVVGISHNSTKKLIEEIRKTKLDKFSAVLSACPYYNRPFQEGIYQHFKQLAKNTEAKIILYNVPSRTASNILPETVIRLTCECTNIIGIKESSGDLSQIYKLIELKNKLSNDFKVISGDDGLALPVILGGGTGVISVIGQAIPDKFSKMISLAIEQKSRNAFELFYQINLLINLIYKEGNPTGIKELLKILGKIKTSQVRLPLIKASKYLEQELKNEALNLDLI